MPSLEMLKKLLDEFSEKEAHTREEINVITEQIGELEKRILTSQQKLSTVAADREKVRAMQARYGGGSTLTPGTPLLGSKPSTVDQPEEAKETPRPRPGRAGSGAAGVDASGLSVAPLNVRASQTRIPAMTPPEPVAETPATTSGLFGTLEAAAAAAAPIAPAAAPAQPKAFSPLDLFGSPADESAPADASAAGVSVHAAAEPPPPLPGIGDYQSGVQYNAGNSYEYQNAQPLDAFPPAGTAPLAPPIAPAAPATAVPPPVAPTPAASAAPASSTSNIGEITTNFFTPLGSTEATLQPSTPLTQPVDAAAQHSLFLDPNQQPAPATQPEDSAQIQDLDEDEPDDTVKSINDALRGLFR